MTNSIDALNGAWDSLGRKTSTFKDIPISDIRIDRRFQRAVNAHAVNKIKAEYHPRGLGQVLLAEVEQDPKSPSDPILACIDGQTRLRALRELEQDVAQGIRVVEGFSPTVTAEVFPALTLEEAALLFRLRNNQRPVPPKERDRIAVTEGDSVMVAMVQQAADAGYVVFDDDDPNRVTMPFVNEAKMIVRWDKANQVPGLLTRALTIQARAFETPEGGLVGTLDPKVLAATAWLLKKNPNVVEDELIRVMAGLGLPALQANAKTRADSEGTRLLGAVKSILVERYNKGKRGSERISR